MIEKQKVRVVNGLLVGWIVEVGVGIEEEKKKRKKELWQSGGWGGSICSQQADGCIDVEPWYVC